MITFRRTKQLGKKNSYASISNENEHLPSYMVRTNNEGDISELRVCPSSSYSNDTLDVHLGDFITIEEVMGSFRFYMPLVRFSDAEKIFNLHQKFKQDIDQLSYVSINDIIDALEDAGFVRAEYIYAGIRCDAIHAGLERYILIDENDNCTAHIWAKNEEEMLQIVSEKGFKYSYYTVKY